MYVAEICLRDASQWDANTLGGFDRRRRDPLWRISERISGENKITQAAADLFYEKIDGLIKKRLTAVEKGYVPDPDAGVDILDLFMQSTTDPYKLGGMVFSFLAAGRKSRYLSVGSYEVR